jgi:hypothetical protein
MARKRLRTGAPKDNGAHIESTVMEVTEVMEVTDEVVETTGRYGKVPDYATHRWRHNTKVNYQYKFVATGIWYNWLRIHLYLQGQDV